MILIYIGILLVFPLAWARLIWWSIPGYDWFELFIPGLLNALALVILLWRFDRLRALGRAGAGRLLLGCGAVLALNALGLVGLNGGWRWRMFFELLWIWPLVVVTVLEKDFVSRTFHWLVFVLGFASLLRTCGELRFGGLGTGLVGNWNWNIALMILAAAALLEEMRRRGIRVRYLAGTAAVLTGCLLAISFGMHGFPKGPWCALGAVVFFFVIREIAARDRRMAGAAVGFALAAGGLAAWVFRARIVYLLTRDVRFDLWKATLELFAEQPFGVTFRFFADRIAGHIPAGYYLGKLAADLHTHPHNEVLYLGAALGIVGLGAALALLLPPLVRLVANRDRRCLFPLGTVLFIGLYAQLDLALASWPLREIFALALGRLYARLAVDGIEKSPEEHPLLDFWARFAAVGAGLFVISELVISGYANYCLYRGRRAEIEQRKREAVQWYERSNALRLSAPGLYQLAQLRLFDEKRPDQAEILMRQLCDQLGYRDYLHSHGLFARALAAQGKFDLALLQFEREARLFPYGPGNLYFQAMTLRATRREAEAAEVFARMKEVARLRNFAPEKMKQWIRPLYLFEVPHDK